MNIITKAPIEVMSNCSGYSGCNGCPNASSSAEGDYSACNGCSHADAGAGKTGRESGSKSAARQQKRAARKAERQERRAARRAKRGARPLKQIVDKGKKWFRDTLHPIRKKEDGTYEKTMADGSTRPVPQEMLAKVKVTGAPEGTPPVLIDKSDVVGKIPKAVMESGVAKAVADYVEKEVTAVTGDDGNIEYYKNSDTEDAAAPAEGTGMSMTTKVLIGVGIAAAIFGGIYLYKKSKKA